MCPGEATCPAIVVTSRNFPASAGSSLPSSSLVHDRDAHRPEQTALGSGQMASRSGAGHEFFRNGLDYRKATAKIAAVGNSASAVQRRRTQYAPGILLPDLFVSFAAGRY